MIDSNTLLEPSLMKLVYFRDDCQRPLTVISAIVVVTYDLIFGDNIHPVRSFWKAPEYYMEKSMSELCCW